jgi:MFS family permease
MEHQMSDRLQSWGRLAVWTVAVYGILLAASTITHQPDYKTDFPAYADYVTTRQFLVSHVLGSIAGAGFALIGAAAIFILAVRSAPRTSGWGFILWSFAQVGLASVFGVAAFFQPAVGRAFIDGGGDVAVNINERVYDGPVLVMVGVGLVLFLVGAILLGMAARRTESLPRWAGLTFAVSAVAFVLSFFLFETVQPVAGLGIAVAGVGFGVGARRVPTTVGSQ